MIVPLTPARFLYQALAQFGDKTAVIDREQRWTFGGHFARCHQLANLITGWRLEPGSRIAFLSYNTHHLLEAYSGVLLSGNVLLPLNIRLGGEDFVYILNDSETEVLFLHPDFASLVSTIRSRIPSVRRFVFLEHGPDVKWAQSSSLEQLLEAEPETFDFDLMKVDENAVTELFYTSGSTARPKGVMLTHRNLYLHALQTAIGLGTRDSDVQLHTIPLFHVNGWGTPQIMPCMGGCQIMMRKFEPRKVFQLVEKHGVTAFSLVPTMATSLVTFPQKGDYDVSSVRLISLGGAASNPRLIREVEETFSCTCVSGYGLTETSPVLTLSWPKSHLQGSQRDRYTVQAMTGYPVPGTELKIVDEEGGECPWDGASMGEIVVRSDAVMKGYWRRPEENHEVFRGGWFHTGDMATIDPDGYVLILDRKKDIIISGGENISSLEVEKAVLSHPAVLECAVIPTPDPLWGEVPLALVVLKEGRQAGGEEILAHCRSKLAGFKVPKTVLFRDSLPKGGTGKILKRDLKEEFRKAETGPARLDPAKDD